MSHAQVTLPSPHAGPSKQRVHSPGRSQLGAGSTGGQPHGGRSRQSSRVFPGRASCRGRIQASGSGDQASARFQGLGVHNTPAHQTLAPSWPQFGRQLPGTVRPGLTAARVGRRVFEGPSFAAVTPLTRRRNVWRQRPPACAAGDRRSGPGERPGRPGRGPCPASSRGGPATSWPARSHAGTGRPLR